MDINGQAHICEKITDESAVSGFFIQYFVNGDVYTGQIQNGNMHGVGKYTYKSGATYEGEFFEGKMHGKGTAISADGKKYVGDVRSGLRHGFGIQYAANGKIIYEGQWEDSRYNGNGKYYKENGTFTGVLKNDFFVEGVLAFVNGDTYTGQFKNDKFNGTGTYKWANGTVYEGIFEDGKILQVLQ